MTDRPDPPSGQHPSEQEWAAFLAAEVRPDVREHLDRHLLACVDCWRDLDIVRHGRDAATSLREYAPDDVRRGIAGLARDLESRPAPTSARSLSRPLGLVITVAALVVAVAGSVLINVVGHRSADGQATSSALAARSATLAPLSRVTPAPAPAPVSGPSRNSTVRTAVRDYLSSANLTGPGTLTSAPDLTSLTLVAAMAGSGTVGDHSVTTYGYVDAAGQRLIVLLSPTPFPRIPASRDAHPATAWTATEDGLTLFVDNGPHPMLILSADHDLTMSAGNVLT